MCPLCSIIAEDVRDLHAMLFWAWFSIIGYGHVTRQSGDFMILH
jgi:hypothetical protein